MTDELPDVARLRTDPVFFCSQLVNPETGQRFELLPAEEQFLRAGFTPSADGSLPYDDLLYSCPKKGGKTTFGAMCTLYVVVGLGGVYAEGFCCANDAEQAESRVFRTAARIVKATGALRKSAHITQSKIEFRNGATITALASDFAGAAGAAPSISTFDELWAYNNERMSRLWDEMVPVPTRKVSVRLTVTHAGFEGESKLLQQLYERGLRGRLIGKDLYAAA